MCGPEAARLAEPDAPISEALQRYWGYQSLRPLQAEAIGAGLARRDSLVVMPTGGGKSLCYQVPPVVSGRTDVVVSPLISLMKDQVDGLRAGGYPAAAVHSQLEPEERRSIAAGIRRGDYRLLFVSPERLLTPRFQQLLGQAGVTSFAIDEAHCISHWGHDFRPEYRQLSSLRQQFGAASIHAFTATATPRVQQDIVAQLGLEEPEILVGRFDRPNLVYRVVPRTDVQVQVLDVLRRHPREAVIIYCITRQDTETLAAVLQARGMRAEPYHAGMPSGDRRRGTQENFASERLDVVVATVAFGMGIDRSDVRCVIHASMPKSIEHYQQETGRAGRDGLEAECILFYSAADVFRWRSLVQRSASREGHSSEAVAAQQELIDRMQGFCTTLDCRHRALTRHFGQQYEAANCRACDVCLGEVESMVESTVTAQKILSGVARLRERYGVGYLVQVLRGATAQNILQRGHDRLSTYGLLRDMPEKALTNLVYQLLEQRLLDRTEGDRPVLKLNDDSRAVLRGEREVRLMEPKAARISTAPVDPGSWEGVDRGLFERLRDLRRRIARQRGVPPYVVFGDATLREMARHRPTDEPSMRMIHGVGRQKLADFGHRFLEAIAEHVREHDPAADD